jgi:chromosome segregation ATPase
MFIFFIYICSQFDNATATIGRLEASLALAQSSGDDTQVKLNSILSQSELKVKQSEQSVRDKEAHITTLNQQLQQFKQNEVVHNEQMSAMRRQLDNQADANPGTQSDSVLSDELYRLKQEKQRLQQKFDDAEQQISDLNDEVDNLRIQQSRRAPVEFSAKNAVMPDEQTDNKSDNGMLFFVNCH